MPSPCPCRGCVAAYKAGLEDSKLELREARRQAYRDGYNAACKARAQADWVYAGRIMTVTSCGWPFHFDPDCGECEQHERKYGQNVDQYLDELAAKTHARKVARRQASPQSAPLPAPHGGVQS